MTARKPSAHVRELLHRKACVLIEICRIEALLVANAAKIARLKREIARE